MHTELGKITSASFGFGGYQECQIVFEFVLSGQGWECIKTFEAGWAHVSETEVKESASFKWTHEDRVQQIGKVGWEVICLMKKAKVTSLNKMVGIPIKANFDGPYGRILSFEILEEVL